MMLDYYERYFLRTAGRQALAGATSVIEARHIAPAIELYEPDDEGVAMTNLLMESQEISDNGRVLGHAVRASTWGDEASSDREAEQILAIARPHEANEFAHDLKPQVVIRSLIEGRRPTIAHQKLHQYRPILETFSPGYYRTLLQEVGFGYCRTAASKSELTVVDAIVDELASEDPVQEHTKQYGIWPFRFTQQFIDLTVKPLHKPLQAQVLHCRKMLAQPDRLKRSEPPQPQEDYTYADAYMDGGMPAALALHAQKNSGLPDPNLFWPYRSIVHDLVEAGHAEAARKIAQEGIHLLRKQYNEPVLRANEHYGITRYIIDDYAYKHDIVSAHHLAAEIPDNDNHTRVGAFRSVAEHYIKGYINELEAGTDIAAETIETCIDYLTANVADTGDRTACIERIMKDVAPLGQVSAIVRLAAELPPQRNSPYAYGRHALFEAHTKRRDYAACSEFLQYWPSHDLAIKALTIVVQQKRSRM